MKQLIMNIFVDNQNLETVDDADGFTIPLTAVAAVECGEIYHIRLAIADGSDGGFIFLRVFRRKQFFITILRCH